jgi:type I restriction enzyme M protein
MNLLLHGLPDHDLRRGDTIRNPRLVEDNEIMLFDRVIANPPFSLKEWGREAAEHDAYGRFRFGIPPKNAGDYAFVQHMIASLKHDGMAGVVMPHGVLFRGGTEGKIRQGILESDLIEAVIGLPSSLFYGTGIPACILIINRNKPEKRKGYVLFIAAESDFQAGKNQNTLNNKNIDKIVNAFNNYEDIEKYARVIPIEEIQSNDFNLNITRYIDKSEEEEQIDLTTVMRELKQLEEEHTIVKAKVKSYLKELGIGEV